MLSSEDVRDHDVVERARDGVLRVGKGRGRGGGRDITERDSHGGMRCVGGHVDRVSCARRCASRLPRKAFRKEEKNKSSKIGEMTSVLFLEARKKHLQKRKLICPTPSRIMSSALQNEKIARPTA